VGAGFLSGFFLFSGGAQGALLTAEHNIML
jgi:hypothetical protein